LTGAIAVLRGADGKVFPMKILAMFLALVMLSGCASRWEHATKRRSDFYSDDRECQVLAGGAAQGIDMNRERVSYESCMWDRGWHKKRTIWFFEPTEK
jgi:hypothetical protein